MPGKYDAQQKYNRKTRSRTMITGRLVKLKAGKLSVREGTTRNTICRKP